MDRTMPKESVLKTWIIIFILLVVILFHGFLSFSVVGDLGQPDWDFGAIKNVPGESSYAVYQLDNPQHVRGLEEERKE
jgi:hypothetical protein